MDMETEQSMSNTPPENRIAMKESMNDSVSRIGQPKSKNTDEEPKRRITANVKETGFDSMKYYMKTMGNHELLKKNEEIILAREIQILIKWEQEREALEAKLIR
jgi:GTP cyclohydrolase I